MSSDRRVLKRMRRRLCDVVGDAMAEALASKARGDESAAVRHDVLAKTLGDEVARIDRLLALKLGPPPPQEFAERATAAMEEIFALGGDAEKDVVQALRRAFREPVVDWKALVSLMERHAWPQGVHSQAATVAAWLRSKL